VKYLVDTSLINKLVDGSVMAAELPSDGLLVASNIQIAEIQRTSNAERRSQLENKMSEVIAQLTEISDELDTQTSVDAIEAKLNSRNKGKASNRNDALLAAYAMKHGYALLTADLDLYEVAYILGVGVMYWTTAAPNKSFKRDVVKPTRA